MGFSKVTDRLSKDIKAYIDIELDLLKHKVVRELSKAIGMGFSFFFLLIFMAVILMLIGMWIGFFLSSTLNSYTAGFGISVLIFLFAFFILIRFRGKLLEKTFKNTAVRLIYKIQREEDDEKGA